MIDLHDHILSGVDDGAATIEESLEMCRIAYADGIRTIVATPHTLNGLHQNDRSSILSKVRELNAALKHFQLWNPKSEVANPHAETPNSKSDIRSPRSKIRMSKPDLTILPGADVHLSEQTIPHLDRGTLTTIGDNGKYLLIEFPFTGIPYGTEEVLHQLVSRGIIPIISHPERNWEVDHNPRRYHEMVQMGCLGQVTGMSLTGGFGPRSKRLAEQMLLQGLVHIIASDAHSTDGRPPILSPAVRAAAGIVGEAEALRMVTEYPQSILEGKRPNVPKGLKD